MLRINKNDAKISCNCFPADALNIGFIRAKLQRAQYKYTLVNVVPTFLNDVV